MLRLLDLFCGAGGMTLGFVDRRFCGGFQAVLSVDSDERALDTHKANIRGATVCNRIEDWLLTEPAIPQADVVIGGPPCQGFSLLNKKRDGDSRRAAWEPYLKIVAMSGARIFVMENVTELLRSPELQKIKEHARQIGFETTEAVLNAADYGAPQTRKRAVVVGWDPRRTTRPNFPPPPTHAAPGTQLRLPNWRTVKDAIGDLNAPKGSQIRNVPAPHNLHFGRNPTQKSLARYRAVPYGGNRFDLMRNALELTSACWVKKASGGTDLFGRLWWDRPSVTIRTEFFKPEKGRYLHPEEHRPITHREAARLMGFPDDFLFRGTKTEIARQIGNAVPPDLAGALAKMLKSTLSADAPHEKRRRRRVAASA